MLELQREAHLLDHGFFGDGFFDEGFFDHCLFRNGFFGYRLFHNDLLLFRHGVLVLLRLGTGLRSKLVGVLVLQGFPRRRPPKL